MLNYYEDIILNLVSTLLSFVSFILTFSFHMKESYRNVGPFFVTYFIEINHHTFNLQISPNIIY